MLAFKLPRLSAWLALLVLPVILPAQVPNDARALYQRLANTRVDPKAVYSVRDAVIDREDAHFTFNDGKLAFTQAVDGRITGMVFSGDGEVLVVAPNLTERQSLGLFTKSGVLNERFYLAYFRFYDRRLVDELKPWLQPLAPDEASAFLGQLGPMVQNLAVTDALRLEMAFLKTPATRAANAGLAEGEFVRARLSSQKLGTFDVVVDSALSEEMIIGQAVQNESGAFYDQWAMFPMRSTRQQRKTYSPDVAVITDVHIRTRVLPPTDIACDASLRMKVNEGGDRLLVFELSRNLKVSSVTIGEGPDAKPLEFLQNESLEGSQQQRIGNDFVAIAFPQALRAGDSFVLNFTYAGPVMQEAGGGLMYVGARGAWYPNRGFWMSNFDLEFRTPAGWKLLATGDLITQETVGQEHISHWGSNRPIPVAGFNLGRYVAATAKTHDGVVIESYATRAMEDTFTQSQLAPNITPYRPPWSRRNPSTDMSVPETYFSPEPARNAQTVAEKNAAFVDFMVPKIGAFPFKSLALTQIPGSASQGWPGLVYLSSYVFLTPQERWQGRRVNPDHPNEILFNSVMAQHETAHQWWGDSIFWRSYRDQWIMEALANYSALLKLEADDPARFRIVMDSYRTTLLNDAEGGKMKDAGAVTLGLRLNSSKFPDSYEAIAYGRGTWLIHMLRHMLRDAALQPGKRNATKPLLPGADPDAAFFAALRRIRAKFDGKVMSTADLQQAFEEELPVSLRFEGKPSLDWFFEYWVGGTAIPKLTLTKTRIAGNIATAVLKQEDAPKLQVTSIPIYAESSAGKISFVKRVFADGEETDLKFTVPAGTKRLVLDPDHTVLRQP